MDLNLTGKVAVVTAASKGIGLAITRALMDHKPAPAVVSSRRELVDVGVTVVRFTNGVDAWRSFWRYVYFDIRYTSDVQ